MTKKTIKIWSIILGSILGAGIVSAIITVPIIIYNQSNSGINNQPNNPSPKPPSWERPSWIPTIAVDKKKDLMIDTQEMSKYIDQSSLYLDFVLYPMVSNPSSSFVIDIKKSTIENDEIQRDFFKKIETISINIQFPNAILKIETGSFLNFNYSKEFNIKYEYNNQIDIEYEPIILLEKDALSTSLETIGIVGTLPFLIEKIPNYNPPSFKNFYNLRDFFLFSYYAGRSIFPNYFFENTTSLQRVIVTSSNVDNGFFLPVFYRKNTFLNSLYKPNHDWIPDFILPNN